MYAFFAKIFRMRHIRRWSLMRCVSEENLAEHTALTAILAQSLAIIRRDVFGRPADPDRAASAALLHDICEIVTGDMPTPIKYHNPALREAYAAVETEALRRLLRTLPAELRGSYAALSDEKSLPPDIAEIVHAADKLAAHIKCVEELAAGNGEFKSAAAQTLEKLKAMGLPEVDYFLAKMLPAFALTLDEQEG